MQVFSHGTPMRRTAQESECLQLESHPYQPPPVEHLGQLTPSYYPVKCSVYLRVTQDLIELFYIKNGSAWHHCKYTINTNSASYH